MIKRAARFVRSLFSSPPPASEDPRDFTRGVGVREPRRPIRPTSSGALALEAPPEERRNVWAVSREA